MAVCEICGDLPATVTCRTCGRAVCGLDRVGDLCGACAEAICAVCGTRLSIAVCALCGRPVCRSCGERRGLARICAACIGVHAMRHAR